MGLDSRLTLKGVGPIVRDKKELRSRCPQKGQGDAAWHSPTPDSVDIPGRGAAVHMALWENPRGLLFFVVASPDGLRAGRDPPPGAPGWGVVASPEVSMPTTTGKGDLMKTTLASAILVSLLLIGIPVLAAETLTLYDNFNSTLINFTKWTGSVSDALEASRSIVFPVAGDGELLLTARGYGFRTGNLTPFEGGEGRGTTNRLKFRRLAQDVIRAIKATVRFNSALATACTTAGVGATQARFRMHGYFFNDGTGEPGHATGDVFARVEVRRLSNSTVANQLEIRAQVQRCSDPACDFTDVLFNQVLGTVLVGATSTLLLQWDQVANQFLFQLNANPLVTFTYTLVDTRGPQNTFDKKYIGINHFIPNCPAVQTQAFMSVNVDDVFLNTAAVAGP